MPPKDKAETHASVYKGKHKYQEVAEFVSIAMSVWDRQHGMISNSWDALNATEKAAAVQRAKDYDEGKLASKEENEDDREKMEFTLYDLLLDSGIDDKEDDIIKELNKYPQGQTPAVPVSSDPNDKPPAPILPSTAGEGTVTKPTIVK